MLTVIKRVTHFILMYLLTVITVALLNLCVSSAITYYLFDKQKFLIAILVIALIFVIIFYSIVVNFNTSFLSMFLSISIQKLKVLFILLSVVSVLTFGMQCFLNFPIKYEKKYDSVSDTLKSDTNMAYDTYVLMHTLPRLYIERIYLRYQYNHIVSSINKDEYSLTELRDFANEQNDTYLIHEKTLNKRTVLFISSYMILCLSFILLCSVRMSIRINREE